MSDAKPEIAVKLVFTDEQLTKLWLKIVGAKIKSKRNSNKTRVSMPKRNLALFAYMLIEEYIRTEKENLEKQEEEFNNERKHHKENENESFK